MPARVLLQDFTGVPAVVDLAAMRDAMAELGGDPTRINPLQPVELVIDHSVQVDEYGNGGRLPDQRRAASSSATASATPSCAGGRPRSTTSSVVPPDTGIVHQVNLEYLARVVDQRPRRRRRTALGLPRHAGRHRLAHHDDQRPGRPRLGRRRHRGRGGDARPAGLDADPPGGRLPLHRQAARGRHRHRPGADRHPDAARARGWSASSSSSSAPGLAELPLADRATIANMAPEYGATCGIFPVDAETLDYLRFTGRPDERVGAGRGLLPRSRGCSTRPDSPEAVYTDTLELDLATVEPSLAGPRRPQDRVPLATGQAVVPRGAGGDDRGRRRRAPRRRRRRGRAAHDRRAGRARGATPTTCTSRRPRRPPAASASTSTAARRRCATARS